MSKRSYSNKDLIECQYLKTPCLLNTHVFKIHFVYLNRVPLYPEGKGEGWLESPPANGSNLNSSLSTTQPLVQSPSLTTGPPQNMTQGTLNSTIWTPAALKPPRETIIYSKMLETDIGRSNRT